MFGEFSISNEYGRFSHINNKSLQITRLLAYLIANKDTEIHKDKLMELLWPDENATNPSGALRNLVYRARQILEEFFPSQEDASGSENAPVECILFSKNAYRWNPELDCEIDIFQLKIVLPRLIRKQMKNNSTLCTRKPMIFTKEIF